MRKKKRPALPSDWFKRWYAAMPEPWQAGLHGAIGGGAFMGELLKRQGHADVIVFFVHPSLAKRVEQILEGGTS